MASLVSSNGNKLIYKHSAKGPVNSCTLVLWFGYEVCPVLWFGYEVCPQKAQVLKAWSLAGGFNLERRLDHEGSNLINGFIH
jgi:hypothetical protein